MFAVELKRPVLYKHLLYSVDLRAKATYCVLCPSLLLRGNTPETRGTAYVVYEDIFDAKNACDHLSGFNVCNRYLVVLYYNANRVRISNVVSFCHDYLKIYCFGKL